MPAAPRRTRAACAPHRRTPTRTTAWTAQAHDRSTDAALDGLSSLVSVETRAVSDTATKLRPDGLAQGGQPHVQSPTAGTPQSERRRPGQTSRTITHTGGALDCASARPVAAPGRAHAALSPQNPLRQGATINDNFTAGQRVRTRSPAATSSAAARRDRDKASFINPDTYRLAPAQGRELSIDTDPLTQNVLIPVTATRSTCTTENGTAAARGTRLSWGAAILRVEGPASGSNTRRKAVGAGRTRT